MPRARTSVLGFILALIASEAAPLHAQDAGLASIATGITEGSRTLREVGPQIDGNGLAGLTSSVKNAYVLLPRYTNSDGKSSLAATMAIVRTFSSGAALQVAMTGSASDGGEETVRSFAPSVRLLSRMFAGGRLRAGATGVFAKTINGGSRSTGTGSLDLTLPASAKPLVIVLGASASIVRLAPEAGEVTSELVGTVSSSLTHPVVELRAEYQPSAGIVAETYSLVASSNFRGRTPLFLVTATKGRVFSIATRFSF